MSELAPTEHRLCIAAFRITSIYEEARPADLNGRASSEVFAGLVPGARVVKAFNHLPPHLLSGDPHPEGGRRVLFHAGDDARAKAAVSTLIDTLGFFAIDLGLLGAGGRLFQFPGRPLPTHNLIKFTYVRAFDCAVEADDRSRSRG